MPKRNLLIPFLALTLLLAGCSKSTETTDTAANPGAPPSTNSTTLRIISGSENKTLAPLIERWAQQNHTTVQVDYRGSVDIMLLLQQAGAIPYDAVWPANSLWIALGDKQKRVKDEQSISWSPVVFGVKKSVADKLGWTNKQVRVADILKVAEAGKLRFMMTSATQSNSGAAAYLGFLYAFAGSPQVLTSADLKKPQVESQIRRILGAVDRSSGSSGWLKDLFLQKYNDYDAMVNYESVVLEANQQLVATNREPLYAVYPVDGLAIADSPLAYVDNGNNAAREGVKRLQEYLLSDPVQKEILALGRRIGPIGEKQDQVDRNVFKPEWGIRTDAFLNQIRYPKTEVIREALDLYQSAFRKPSITIYCLDYSGSMQGERIANLKSAMQAILDQDKARQNLLQASGRDITVVIPFSDHIMHEWTVTGNDPTKYGDLWAKVSSTKADGGTDIYSPIMRGFEILKGKEAQLKGYFPAIILMTDGESNTGKRFSDLAAFRNGDTVLEKIPVFGIQFGEASDSQLSQITDLTTGRLFDGRKNLTAAFREAKGYN